MKRFFALMLALLCCVTLFACGDKSGDGEPTSAETPSDEPSTTTTAVTTAATTIAAAATLTGEFSYKPVAKTRELASGNYVKISALESKYVASNSNTVTFYKLDLPQFELAGAYYTPDAETKLTRIDPAKKDAVLAGLAKGNKMADNINAASGATIRFRTNAKSIWINAKLDTIPGRDFTLTTMGTTGIAVYKGSGNDYRYIENSDNPIGTPYKDGAGNGTLLCGQTINAEVQLYNNGAYTEVLIELPLYAEVESLSIGFSKSEISAGAKIAEPIKRDHAPVVFYGADITQGLSATGTTLAYANIIGRMLGVDTINHGYVKGAKGEASMAEYIAGLDMSAFVMELGMGMSTDELRANYYNFYKTVRNAKADIPIVLVSEPIFTKELTADDQERLDIIKETYDKALAEGDTNIYLIDGSKIFRNKGLIDLYTSDYIHPNDLGIYNLALGVYDAINSAFSAKAE